MRVLWLVRRNLREHPGGDTTQILQTAAALRRHGITVDLGHDETADPSDHDLVHLFHLDRLWENLDHARRARAAGVPIALSTIYWPADEFDRYGRWGLQGWLARRLGSAAYQDLRLGQRYLLHCWERWRIPRPGRIATRFRAAARELLNLAAVLLPNSYAEQRVIEERFGVSRPTVVVPNGVDIETFAAPAEGGARDGVLCVGRIEPRKNQLALIRALAGTGIPLTIVGHAGRFSRGYARRCRRAAGPDVRFVPNQAPGALRDMYGAARVHACVSWYETPGLASLEAALCGCALVVTPGGCTREYFGEEAHYAQPNDVASIRTAVKAALEQPVPARLAERVANECTWTAAAGKTLVAYRQALVQI